MRLKDLIKDLDIISIKGAIDGDVTDIAYHTSMVRAGALFVAVKGTVTDGHDFINEAVKKGAIAVIAERNTNVPRDLVVVKNSRVALARLSAKFFGEPSEKINLIGITGTNGKTTVSYILESMLKEAGFVPAVIGTVEHRFCDKKYSAQNTTPESYELQKLLREMVDCGANACVMEVSSHALSLGRVVGCHFNGAVFTNLSSEHLDFHGDMELYFKAKLALFMEGLSQSSKNGVFAAVNIDDPFGLKIVKNIKHKLIGYSLSQDGEITASDILCNSDGIRMKIKIYKDKILCRSKLMGLFNVSNILAATAAGVGLSLPVDAILKGIEKVVFVPGRMEPIPNKRGIMAFVDYAHTPAALENVLKNARGFLEKTRGRLMVVFGCGGDRDRTKRPLMGMTASNLADILVVTNDNPRTENPEAIIGEILSGIGNSPCEVIPDRRSAISRAVELANKGDVLIVAGKGHEDYQILGKEKKPFDDREVLLEYLS